MRLRKILTSARRMAALAALALISSPAFAGGSGMPWEDPLQKIADSLTGPVAKVAGILAVALAGLGFAFSEGGGFLRKVLGIVFGLAIAFAASTFFIPFFGFSGGAAF